MKIGGTLMACYNIMSLLVNNRVENVSKMQEVLTESGCIIRTRLGIHDAGDVCSNDGLIILQLVGEKEEIKALEDALNALEGIKAKNMEICSEW
jgi:metal-responsive CopG/Arc/MetJ family transcriptional regulator